MSAIVSDGGLLQWFLSKGVIMVYVVIVIIVVVMIVAGVLNSSDLIVTIICQYKSFAIL